MHEAPPPPFSLSQDALHSTQEALEERVISVKHLQQELLAVARYLRSLEGRGKLCLLLCYCVYIYKPIFVCVCVCVCVKERDREQRVSYIIHTYMYMYKCVHVHEYVQIACHDHSALQVSQ